MYQGTPVAPAAERPGPAESPARPAAAVGWREALAAGIGGTLGSLLLYGYDGARWVDAPIIRSFQDARLYTTDPFIAPFHQGTPAAIPYRLLAAAGALVAPSSLTLGLLPLYLIATVAAIALVYALAQRMFADRAVALIALGLYLAGARLLGIGSPALGSAEMTPQVLALPLELGALYALLAGREVVAGLLFGLAFNLHAPVAGQLGLLFGGWLLLRRREIGAARLAGAAVVALLAAGPTLVGSALAHLRPLEPWEIHLAILTTGSDLSVAESFQSRALAAANVVGIAFLGFLALRVRPAAGGRLVRWLLAGSVLLLLGGWLAVDALDVPALATVALRLNIARASWLANLLGVLLLAGYVRAAWRRDWPPRPLLLVLLGGALAVPSSTLPIEPLLPAALVLVLAADAALRVAPAQQRLLGLLASAAALLLALGCLALGLRGTALNGLDFGLAVPAVVFAALLAAVFYGIALARLAPARRPLAVGALLGLILVVVAVYRNGDDWLHPVHAGEQPAEDVIAWARTTPPDSEFLLPPSSPFSLEFQRRADRSVFVLREGANHGLYFPQNNVEFARRVAALGVADPLAFPDRLDDAYDELTTEQVRAIARQYGVRYFIPASGNRYPFPDVFRVAKYVVYRVGG